MKEDYYIITGTSRGIGEAMARKLIRDGKNVVCISRTKNPKLKVEASVKEGAYFRDITFDLTDIGQIPDIVHQVMRKIPESNVQSIHLINNAGVIHPIRPVGMMEGYERMRANLDVNLVAPFVLTNHFVRVIERWEVEKKVLCISSGAATSAYHGWAAYCTGKAGLNMFCEVLALEQQEVKFPVKVVAVAPGIIDTEMQEEIRATKEKYFPNLNKFKELHEQGELKKSAVAAAELIDLLNSPGYGKEVIVNL